MRKYLGGSAIIAVALGAFLGLSACVPEADVASHNLSKDADNFKIDRRIVFYNGITDTYMLTIEGRCSLGNNDSAGQLTVTCKTGPDGFRKHFLGLSDNVTYFVEQLEPADVSVYHYKVVFRPQVIIPDVEFGGSVEELLK
jgi:hypothetical protein